MTNIKQMQEFIENLNIQPVNEGQGLLILVRDDLDAEILPTIELRGIGQGLVPDLVQGVRRVGDQLTKEDLLVRVERVDDEGHELGDLRLEGEGLDLRVHGLADFRHLYEWTI